ncbi:hypothetical protein Krac_10328 [Ktedonobacter racemifer DSM 44963]|uniref:Uncharacterized protein n=2 Tax=Ktedonobacter racemifer TaxID=363277 RepID=D6TGC4_KTERA|nr:hypothetical protein Krac_10328 [Ktedonobacter racemifer DSM 44963]
MQSHQVLSTSRRKQVNPINNMHDIQLSDGRVVRLTPEQALAFLTWLHDQMPDLPEALAAWLAQQQQHTHDLPPLEPYCVVERAPDGHYHIADFGLDLPDESL